MGSALVLNRRVGLTPTTGSEMTAGTPQADSCQPCLLEIEPSTCIHLPPCMNGYLSLAIHQCHLTTECQHPGFLAMHTWSLMEAQEVYVTNTMPRRVLFTDRGLVAIFSANLCSRHATKVTEEYALGKPLSLFLPGLWVGGRWAPTQVCGAGGPRRLEHTLNNPAPGKQWAQFCMFPPPSSLHSEADNGSPFCVHSPLHLCQKS